MRYLLYFALCATCAASELLRVTFEEDFTAAEFLEDTSGNARNLIRYGQPPVAGSEWNFPAPIDRTNAAGEIVSKAGAFTYRTNVPYGIYSKLGDYAGTELVSDLRGLSQATVSVWAHYNQNKVDPTTYLGEHTATLVSAGQTVNGSWILGRDSTHFTKFAIKTPSGSARVGPGFPDFVHTTAGETDGWNHYLCTFSNGVARTYWNGVFYQEVVTTQPTLEIGGTWLAIGCQTHNGTPWLDDEGPAGPSNDFPNHAWLNGGMDQLRIFSHVLNDAEITALYATESEPCVECPEPPDPVLDRLNVLTGKTVLGPLKEGGLYYLEFTDGTRITPVQSLIIE